MKIVFVNQFFWPDVAATGQLLTDLTRALAERHEITVICSGGRYESTQAGGEPPAVTMIRIPGPRYSRGALGRAVSYATFFTGALWHQLRMPKPDAIVSMTTPPLLGAAGAIVKRLRKVRHYLWEMDLFPDALVSLGALPERGWITRGLHWLADLIRRGSDGIIVLGPCMRRRLLSRGIPAHLVHIAENWADGETILPRARRRSGPLRVLYSGNLGLSHDIGTIAAALRRFANDRRLEFTFAGGGVGRDELERVWAAETIGNVRFLPYASRAAMGRHLAWADVGLVTEKPECIGTVVPSKVYGLMAAARPILFIGPRAATPGLCIRRFGCGWQIETGDVDGLCQLLESLYRDRQQIGRRGRRALRAFRRHYDVKIGVLRIATILGLQTPQSAELVPVPRGTRWISD